MAFSQPGGSDPPCDFKRPPGDSQSQSRILTSRIAMAPTLVRALEDGDKELGLVALCCWGARNGEDHPTRVAAAMEAHRPRSPPIKGVNPWIEKTPWRARLRSAEFVQQAVEREER
jgi:hypothetical protein